jgi:hypothetical protein
MTLKEKIEKDFIEAYKTKDELKTSVLRMIKSSIKNKEIANGKDLGDTALAELIAKEIKQRRDSSEQYKAGDRAELAEKEDEEIKILANYMPEQMPEDEIAKIVDEAIAKTGANNPADMGKVMGAIMPQVKGKADGTLVSNIVKTKLSK